MFVCVAWSFSAAGHIVDPVSPCPKELLTHLNSFSAPQSSNQAINIALAGCNAHHIPGNMCKAHCTPRDNIATLRSSPRVQQKLGARGKSHVDRLKVSGLVGVSAPEDSTAIDLLGNIYAQYGLKIFYEFFVFSCQNWISIGL